MNVMNRFARGDDRGRHVGKDGQAGGHGSAKLAGGVQERVVGAAVQRQRAHHFGVDGSVELQDQRNNQERHGTPSAPVENRQGGNIQTR